MFDTLPAPAPAPEVRLDVCAPGPRVDDGRPGEGLLADLAQGDEGVLAEVLEQLVDEAVAAAQAAAEAADARRAALAGTPGPVLAALLAGLDAPTESDAVLVEAIDAFDRLASWVVSRQAVMVNELRRRRQAQGRGAFVGDEVAARLGTTRAAGERIVGEAMGLEQVPQVWDALDRGDIDPRKASVLCDELLALPALVRFEVAEEVVAAAGGLTAPALRARIRRRALAVDPEAARRAHERERRARFVSLEPVRDGMAWLHAYLPAPEAVAVHTTLTALADAAPADDPRGIDERRADALVGVVTRWLDAGTCPDGTPLPRRQRRLPHLQVTVAASTLAGLDEAPAELAGYGPIAADAARRIAAGATWSTVLVDPATGEARPVRQGPPGLRRTGAPPGAEGLSGSPGVPGAGVSGSADSSGAAGSPDSAKVPGAARSPGSTAPSGSPPGYRPRAALLDEVLTRDRTCTFPGCRVPATRCDIDHIEPFDPARPADEQTVEANLHALCRHHHNLKTHGGWQVARDEATGQTRWTAPTGHTYPRRPEPAVGGQAATEVVEAVGEGSASGPSVRRRVARRARRRSGEGEAFDVDLDADPSVDLEAPPF